MRLSFFVVSDDTVNSGLLTKLLVLFYQPSFWDTLIKPMPIL